MSDYRPPQRIIDCTILTTSGFITANLHILDKGLVVEQLDAVDEFYKLTNASLVGIETTVEFFALQRDAVIFWVPKGEPDEMLQHPITPPQQDRVHVLFPGGLMSGDLVWRKDVRLSDYVTKQDGYILLRDATIKMNNLGADRQVPAVVLNVNHIVGISTASPL